MRDYNNNRDKQLEKLLQLKRFEMPSEERWLEFDYAFENRRLSAIKESRIRGIFTSLRGILNFKRIVCSVGFCLLLLIICLASARQQRNISSMQMAREVSKKYVQFASDSVLVNDDDIDVRAGICNISYPNDGIEYVQDTLTMQNSSSLPIRMWN
ncbi:MAG: hypothetical protein LBC30_04070 [Puniceicoccales bacterium]|jgi:hypothetical protein|nr:hypothetical protein [Puniceicoccales bacterium]